MKKLVCIGGGDIPRFKDGILLPYETKQIDEEIVRLSNKEHPKVLFISIASAHPDEYFEGFRKVYENLGCIVSHLDISKNIKEIEYDILNTDIIYVGGGNTNNLFAGLKNIGIDKLLIKAYENGIVCAGISAGSYCWFKYKYDLLEGMGIINSINCVHYNQKDESVKNEFYGAIKEKQLIGYAIDDCVAIEFLDEKINVIKSKKENNAYKVTYENGKFIKIKL